MSFWITTAALLAALSACGTPPPTVEGTPSAVAPVPSASSPGPTGPPEPPATLPPGTIPAPAQRPPGTPSAAPTTAPPPPQPEPSAAAASSPATPATAARPDSAELSDPASVTVVVNKRRPLDPIDYFPSGLVLPAVPLAVQEPNALLRGDTAAAVQDLSAAAADDGVGLTLVSGYRSYQDQVSTYEHWVAQNGGDTAAADRISARAGFSEHQTGLAFDVGQDDGACTLSPCFADTAAGQWMAANAHRFGFILRYPNGAEGITGFSGEAWHYRYVGVDVAQAMRAEGTATLEEYFGLPAAPGY
ncbi:MAG: M15 family metallopeptidase [Actinomycetes bacterium]